MKVLDFGFRIYIILIKKKRVRLSKGEDMLLTKTVAQAERAWFERAKRVRERGRARARFPRRENR